jgi:UDP-glucose 4-epimerase
MDLTENSVIFITGGAGFIGSTLASRLVDKHKVIIFDNLDRNAIQYSDLLSHKNINFIQGDIMDLEKIESIFKEYAPDYIVHCAAIAGVDTVIKDPVRTLDINILGTNNVLKACRLLPNLKRIVLFSTSEVFGSDSFNSNESKPAVIGAVGEARWTYALSKLANEHYADAYFKKYRVPTVILRPFNIYGPGQVGEGALSIFIKQAIKNETITIHGDGSQIRAWCYVDDMVRGVMLSMTHIDAIGKSFNIGNPRSTLTIYGLANAVVRILNSQSKILFVPKTHADIELRMPDVRQAKEVIDFVAEVDLEEGIPLTADYYRKHG